MCRDKFFLQKSREMGYSWNSNFLMGNIEGSPLKISWRGKQNVTWTEMLEILYSRTDGNDGLIYKYTMDSITGKRTISEMVILTLK